MKMLKDNYGFTLIEVLVYVGILTVAVAVMSSFVLAIIRLNSYTATTADVLRSAERAVEIIDQEIRLAESVYTETSVFGASPGQLSVVTRVGAPPGETETYVDFYIDDGRLYVKREGQTPELIIAQDIRITNFTLTRFTKAGAPSSQAIRIDLTARRDTLATASSYTGEVHLFKTSSLRSY
ncbi:MAG: prepilin-type N-terminal cleavage/methylation domain-containing protein [Candidatus Jacksonbacteria bacterium]|nr:prepilin-type N-terminal cleavage/methylation domain-containing protein [Candidatus Jacksonbacteria bacterium]